jgi:anti-sigma factor RsiW
VADQNGRVHGQVAELLSAYIDDEVNADERALVEAHLATCAACAQDLTTLRGTVALVGQLPQVAAPRPFTVRESDVRPVRDAARPTWWRLPWAQGLVGAAAVLLCVVVVGGVVLLGRGGMVGAPAAPVPVAMEAGIAADEAADERVVEEPVAEEAETLLGAEKEVGQALDSAAPPPEPAAEEVPAELEMAAEAPAAEAAPVEEKMAANGEGALMATQPARAASGMATEPSATPAPMATTTPPPAAEAAPAAPSPTPILLEAEDLILEIEPGIIRARGRLPLPEGRTLLAVLWRDGQPVEWATIESRRLVVAADGEFYLVLLARAEVPDLDLRATEPAYYEIRIRPVDPPAPVEIRIPLDIHDTPPPTPTSTS